MTPASLQPTHALPGRARVRVAVAADPAEEPLRRAAAELARGLGLAVAGPEHPDCDLLLVATPERLELRDARNPRMGPVYVDFSSLDLRPFGPGLSRRQPLARAFGKKVRTIADATAGYAQDALLLTLMGFQVTAIERSAAVAALARDGLRRLQAQTGLDLGGRFQLTTGDARTLLPALARPPDAVYLDPMFPPKRKKSAAVKKEMQLLRALVGEDEDAFELFEIGRRAARDRVVVKRPDDAAPLAPKPDMSFPGKLVRYDVYLVR